MFNNVLKDMVYVCKVEHFYENDCIKLGWNKDLCLLQRKFESVLYWLKKVCLNINCFIDIK